MQSEEKQTSMKKATQLLEEIDEIAKRAADVNVDKWPGEEVRNMINLIQGRAHLLGDLVRKLVKQRDNAEVRASAAVANERRLGLIMKQMGVCPSCCADGGGHYANCREAK